MNDEVTRALLEVLLGRIERDASNKAWRIAGVISEPERNALANAVGRFGGEVQINASAAGSRFSPVPKSRAAELNLEALRRTQPENPEILLCLDFGTAVSKAMATLDTDNNLLELGLGKSAGDVEQVFGLRSSLFITRSGRIHFGHDAVLKSAEAEDGVPRERLDSLKQRLSQGMAGALSEGMLEEPANPTNVPLSWSDVIVLYLGYLTDIATGELAGKGYSRYVRRRFARPCWEHGRATWADGELRVMLARAQIVADTFRGRWAEGIPADEAKATLDAVGELDQIPEYLLAEGVPEPIAAAATRIETESRDRGVFVVVDVGAGTTDFAVFWSDQDPDQGRFKVWQIPGTVAALSQAGDTIDGYLLAHVLEKAHLRPGGDDYRYAFRRLSQGIRQNKEILMKTGSIDVILPNSTEVRVTRDEFLKAKAVKDFGRLLQDKLAGVLRQADKSWFDQLASFAKAGRDRISIVLTGGGSALEPVRKLATSVIEVHGTKFQTERAREVPAWITENYPLMIPSYAQLAVAIGGAARNLPELGPETAKFSGLGGPVNWNIASGYKK